MTQEYGIKVSGRAAGVLFGGCHGAKASLLTS